MKQGIALIGAAALGLGAFLPVLHIPIVGSISWVLNGSGSDGIIVVILAFTGFLLALFKQVGWASVCGWLALVPMAIDLTSFVNRVNNPTPEMANNMFYGLLKNTITLGEAWPVMGIGAASLICAAFIGPSKPASPALETREPGWWKAN